MNISEEEYQAAIPKCCRYQTVQEHYDQLLLCWGLTHSITTGKPHICGCCIYNIERDKDVQV